MIQHGFAGFWRRGRSLVNLFQQVDRFVRGCAAEPIKLAAIRGNGRFTTINL